MSDALVVREVAIGKLDRAEWNANRVDEAGMARLRRSVEQFGMVDGGHRRCALAGVRAEYCMCLRIDDDRL